MSSSVFFVTAIYNGLHNHKDFSGRANRGVWYNESMKVLNNMNANFELFSTPTVFESLKSYNLNNITETVHSLYDFPFSDYIINHQKIHGKQMPNRSHHVMYGKFYWLGEVCNKLDEEDTVFWIDAGLSNRGVFPNRASSNGKVNPADLKVFYNMDKIFTPSLRDSLYNKSIDNLLFLGIDNDKCINSLTMCDYNIARLSYNGNIIGGLFGGRVKFVREFVVLFKEVLQKMMHNGDLFTEEKIMTILVNTMDIPNTILRFSSWYHEDTNHAPNKTLKNFCDVFTDDLGVKL